MCFYFQYSKIYLPLSLSETLATKYEGKLQKEMAGPTYEMFSKVMKFVVGQKIFVPGNFVSSRNTQAITCSHKANSGYLYPLERGFMFVVKPPVYIRFDEISSVNFSRVASGKIEGKWGLLLLCFVISS